MIYEQRRDENLVEYWWLGISRVVNFVVNLTGSDYQV